MIPHPIQALAVLAALVYLLLIVLALRSSRMNVRQSLLWLTSGVVFLLISLFPNLLIRAGYGLGFIAPSNALFLLWCLTLTMLVFYQSLTTSRQSQEIRNLAQALAIERLSNEELRNAQAAPRRENQACDSDEER